MTTPLRHVLPAVLTLALIASVAVAEPAAPASVASAPADTVPAIAITAAIPATTLAADLATMQAANPLPVRDDDAVTITEHADGTRSAVLDASFLSTMVVRLGPDGQPVFGCVDSPAAYDAFFSPTAQPAAPTLEVR
jgi:hypothetical protein